MRLYRRGGRPAQKPESPAAKAVGPFPVHHGLWLRKHLVHALLHRRVIRAEPLLPLVAVAVVALDGGTGEGVYVHPPLFEFPQPSISLTRAYTAA